MSWSTLIPPAELSLSEDLDTTYSLIFADYDQDLRVLSGSYEGLKSPKKVQKIVLANFAFKTQEIPGIVVFLVNLA